MTDTVASARAALRSRARAEVAASVIAPYYGLDAAIAVNPLLPALSRGYSDAIAHAAPAVGARGALDEQQYRALLDSGRIAAADLAAAIRRRSSGGHAVAAHSTDSELVESFLAQSAPAPAAAPTEYGRVDELVARWCRAALNPDGAAWPVPVAELGFFGAWRALARHDASLPRRARRRIAGLPDVADRALATIIDRLGVSEHDELAYFRAGLARLPGWAAYVNWRAMTSGDVDIVDVLAVRAALEWALDEPSSPHATRGEGDDDEWSRRTLIWQESFEAAPHRRVLEQLTPGAHAAAEPRAHLVFCIDPRSEGLRRHLERRGSYDTSGFAGFFGIAALVEPLAAMQPSAACPVLLTPRYRVAERPAPGAWREAARFVRALSFERALRSSAKAPDSVPGAPLGWAEVTGWLLGPRSVARSLLAGRTVRRARPDDPAMSVHTLLDLDSALTPDEQLETAEVILRTMGMVDSFAPYVVFLGHGTSTTNNAFRTALDCGACGGHRGAPNARAAGTILNTPAVRVGLRERGIDIPEQTVFLAGEHDTATDDVTLADLHRLDPTQRAAALQIEGDARAAGRDLAAERLLELPGAPRTTSASTAVARRSRDWAQVYPEWGLARNAAIVIGPRSLTATADLERRVFLHSYEAKHDLNGTALETILTAPLVVAHWINAQYYFSAVDPVVFGAGSKTVHNLVAGAGVLSGPSGDLRLGLPWQSIGTRAGLHHEPVRLLVVVDAPRERIDSIVSRADIVGDLVHGEWVTLVRPADEPGQWERCTAAGWVSWSVPDADKNRGKEAA
ncbi:MAG: DUF2309 domain-containing protein [Microcella sp.]|uniref:DUF2309 domain-containing protein n=1 Tax=Microcella sp. TaxID=1913979 RepID=UPI003315FCA4